MSARTKRSWNALAVLLFSLAIVALVMLINKHDRQSAVSLFLFSWLGFMCIRKGLRSR